MNDLPLPAEIPPAGQTLDRGAVRTQGLYGAHALLVALTDCFHPGPLLGHVGLGPLEFEVASRPPYCESRRESYREDADDVKKLFAVGRPALGVCHCFRSAISNGSEAMIPARRRPCNIFMAELLILTTTDSQTSAEAIATALVEGGDAACVNIVPGIRSVYRWEGKVCNEGEFLLLIKSTSEHFEAVRTRIRALHTYELPEVVAIELVAGDPGYLDWLRGQVRD